jgi:mannan endo-1,4-beta-mannosidase
VKSTGIFFLAAITFLFSCNTSPPPVENTPVSASKPKPVRLPAESSPNKKRLLNYLSDMYGKYIISGQMDAAWTTNEDIDMISRVYSDTGKYPAMKGFDFIMLSLTFMPFMNGREQINEAIEWWEGKNNGKVLLPNKPSVHGIVTFCWHWRTGDKNEFYTNKTNFRIPWKNSQLDTESAAFREILSDLDKVALRFQTLKEKDIPVLWRPLHEASGGWFWWGASGSKPYIALWEFMWDYLTYEKGLDNLIWVWNGDSESWFPDPKTVDIIGRDIYAESHSSLKDQFERTKKMGGGKEYIVALSENGKIPDPDNCVKDGAMWSWFMTWNDSRKTGESHKDNFFSGEFHNKNAHKKKVYSHPAVITLDKLPDLTKYRLE